MAPNTVKRTANGPPTKKKEKVFHPQSRKADQLVRAQQLADLARSRTKKHGEQVNLFGFFYHVIPPEGELTAEDMHTIVRDVWLARWDSELEAERKARRKGRSKSTREQNLESVKEREAEEYRTGIEIIDLTHPLNVALFRQWDQKEAAYTLQLRMTRISSASPETFVVTRPGRNPLLVAQAKELAEQEAAEGMDTDEAPLLLEPPSRFSSTMMTMDTVPP
ncbi:hypothetical protein EIP91_010318 [Steccherinum ochraceum]|uniref:Translation machinery-associated protein 16 n=1 Tax=Steccherinum ochraceum TaxID=92696 RepID=A0A4R0R9X3_9APHY|nr:hypothetical protein EIP91_010318 [Steccherinum ochraceum]